MNQKMKKNKYKKEDAPKNEEDHVNFNIKNIPDYPDHSGDVPSC